VGCSKGRSYSASEQKSCAAPHTLFGELPLPLNPADMLDHRVAEDDIETAGLKIRAHPFTDT